ncbi:hypothetical protein BB559_000783 [Furculomyces boomerangus]|uniref:Exonuclease domain-containing protein n=1 Tax=Furculomyces boomerangus TaxID=61424 RepID=A0A2T9Z478_9FUNG|nr:hypothetical protein BB559_000783 [Furculomyces boomerangus]
MILRLKHIFANHATRTKNIVSKSNFSVISVKNNIISKGIDQKETGVPWKATYPLFWVDVETTGLDLESNILEVSLVVTDNNLEIIDEGVDLVFSYPDTVLENMNSWCKKTHSESGLIDLVKKSTLRIDEGEKVLLEVIKKHCPVPKRAIMAGNSVHFDQMFLFKYMPALQQHMHFRIIDVSTINELGKRWAPETTKYFGKKMGNHRYVSKN